MDTKQFETFFRYLQPRLFAFCCKYVNDKEIARDLVQECFISFWENKESVSKSPEAYLFTSVRNRSLSHIRSQKIHSDYHESIKLQIKEFEFHPDTPAPVIELYTKEVSSLLNEALEQLPERCREIFIMSRFRGLKNKEIADALNISTRTVESQVYQALKLIKKHLKDYFPLITFLFRI